MDSIVFPGLRHIHRKFMIWTPPANSESGYQEKETRMFPLKKKLVIKISYLSLEFPLHTHCKKRENSSY